MVDEPVLAYVDEPVIAIRIGGQQEEAGIDKIPDRVVDDSLHHFAVEELQPHPDSMDDGRAGMEVETLVMRVSIKAVDIEDSLDLFSKDLLDDIRFQAAHPEALR